MIIQLLAAPLAMSRVLRKAYCNAMFLVGALPTQAAPVHLNAAVIAVGAIEHSIVVNRVRDVRALPVQQMHRHHHFHDRITGTNL